MQTQDPYSFAAERLPSDTRDAIGAFWAHFAAHADDLDRCFSSNMTDMTVDPAEVMAALQQVSPELMWEFGPSDRGHALTITAEWHDQNRPLARAMLETAPDLPRWRFHEARGPESASMAAADYFTQRFKEPLCLSRIDIAQDVTGRINLTGHGHGDDQMIFDHTLKVASAILGETVERDWVGFIDVAAVARPGLLARLRKQTPESFDAKAFADSFAAMIATVRSGLPDRPYAAWPLDDRAVTLFKANGLPQEHPRADLLTFAAADQTYAQSVLSHGRFSSACHSNHGEWFLYLRIMRTEDRPFDNVSERGDLEENLHQLLSGDGIGGVVGAGHGHDAVYIDIAVTDISAALGRIAQALSGLEATVHFMDQGLHGMTLAAAPELNKTN